jgi:hypothetical protein
MQAGVDPRRSTVPSNASDLYESLLEENEVGSAQYAIVSKLLDSA